MYGIHEDTGHVSRLRISADLSDVTVLQTKKLPGGGPAHVLVDEQKVRRSHKYEIELPNYL